MLKVIEMANYGTGLDGPDAVWDERPLNELGYSVTLCLHQHYNVHQRQRWYLTVVDWWANERIREIAHSVPGSPAVDATPRAAAVPALLAVTNGYLPRGSDDLGDLSKAGEAIVCDAALKHVYVPPEGSFVRILHTQRVVDPELVKRWINTFTFDMIPLIRNLRGITPALPESFTSALGAVRLDTKAFASQLLDELTVKAEQLIENCPKLHKVGSPRALAFAFQRAMRDIVKELATDETSMAVFRDFALGGEFPKAITVEPWWHATPDDDVHMPEDLRLDAGVSVHLCASDCRRLARDPSRDIVIWLTVTELDKRTLVDDPVHGALAPQPSHKVPGELVCPIDEDQVAERLDMRAQAANKRAADAAADAEASKIDAKMVETEANLVEAAAELARIAEANAAKERLAVAKWAEKTRALACKTRKAEAAAAEAARVAEARVNEAERAAEATARSMVAEVKAIEGEDRAQEAREATVIARIADLVAHESREDEATRMTIARTIVAEARLARAKMAEAARFAEVSAMNAEAEAVEAETRAAEASRMAAARAKVGLSATLYLQRRHEGVHSPTSAAPAPALQAPPLPPPLKAVVERLDSANEDDLSEVEVSQVRVLHLKSPPPPPTGSQLSQLPAGSELPEPEQLPAPAQQPPSPATPPSTPKSVASKALMRARMAKKVDRSREKKMDRALDVDYRPSPGPSSGEPSPRQGDDAAAHELMEQLQQHRDYVRGAELAWLAEAERVVEERNGRFADASTVLIGAQSVEEVRSSKRAAVAEDARAAEAKALEDARAAEERALVFTGRAVELTEAAAVRAALAKLESKEAKEAKKSRAREGGEASAAARIKEGLAAEAVAFAEEAATQDDARTEKAAADAAELAEVNAQRAQAAERRALSAATRAAEAAVQATARVKSSHIELAEYRTLKRARFIDAQMMAVEAKAAAARLGAAQAAQDLADFRRRRINQARREASACSASAALAFLSFEFLEDLARIAMPVTHDLEAYKYVEPDDELNEMAAEAAAMHIEEEEEEQVDDGAGIGIAKGTLAAALAALQEETEGAPAEETPSGVAQAAIETGAVAKARDAAVASSAKAVKAADTAAAQATIESGVVARARAAALASSVKAETATDTAAAQATIGSGVVARARAAALASSTKTETETPKKKDVGTRKGKVAAAAAMFAQPQEAEEDTPKRANVRWSRIQKKVKKSNVGKRAANILSVVFTGKARRDSLVSSGPL